MSYGVNQHILTSYRVVCKLKAFAVVDSGVYWSGGDFLEAFKENIVYMCIAVGHQIIKKASVIKGKIYINNLHE